MMRAMGYVMATRVRRGSRQRWKPHRTNRPGAPGRRPATTLLPPPPPNLSGRAQLPSFPPFNLNGEAPSFRFCDNWKWLVLVYGWHVGRVLRQPAAASEAAGVSPPERVFVRWQRLLFFHCFPFVHDIRRDQQVSRHQPVGAGKSYLRARSAWSCRTNGHVWMVYVSVSGSGGL
jgi:hypothetical protein